MNKITEVNELCPQSGGVDCIVDIDCVRCTGVRANISFLRLEMIPALQCHSSSVLSLSRH